MLPAHKQPSNSPRSYLLPLTASYNLEKVQKMSNTLQRRSRNYVRHSENSGLLSKANKARIMTEPCDRELLPKMSNTFNTSCNWPGHQPCADAFRKQVQKLKASNFKSKQISVCLTSRERKSIEKNVSQCWKPISVNRGSKLKSAEKMMTAFHKELRHVKERNIMSKKIEDKKDLAKEIFEAYSVTCMGSHNVENQDYVKMADGVYLICDGHGSNGREVAKYVGDAICKKCVQCRAEGKVDRNSLIRIFMETEKDLEFSGLDIAFSGTTCLLAVCVDRQITVANVGDSMAAVKNEHRIQILSATHRLDRQSEKERIEEAGGVVAKEQVAKGKFSGPLRIWAPGRNASGPGLAVSRFFGMKAARRYGVISEPELKSTFIVSEDNFVLMGSDGLFDAINYSDAINFIKRHPHHDAQSRQIVCELLVEEAQKKSHHDFGDISVLVIFS